MIRPWVADRRYQSCLESTVMNSQHASTAYLRTYPPEYQGLKIYEQPDCPTIIINPSFGQNSTRGTIAIHVPTIFGRGIIFR